MRVRMPELPTHLLSAAVLAVASLEDLVAHRVSSCVAKWRGALAIAEFSG